MLGVWHLWEVLGKWHIREQMVFHGVFNLLTKVLDRAMRSRKDANVLFAELKKPEGLGKFIASQLMAFGLLSLLLAVGQNYLSAIMIYGNGPIFSASGIWGVRMCSFMKPTLNVLFHYLGRAKVKNPRIGRSPTIEMEIRALRMTKADLPLRESWSEIVYG